MRQEFIDICALRARGYETGHIVLARSLCEGKAEEGNTIALMDIGIIGFRCFDQNILDITGLTDRFIAKSKGEFLKKRYPPEYVLDQNPEYIVLVVTAPGKSYTVPPPSGAFSMSRTEDNLFQHPEFRKYYIHPHTGISPDADWLTQLAAKIGATKIFEHGHPGLHYLLALFERK